MGTRMRSADRLATAAFLAVMTLAFGSFALGAGASGDWPAFAGGGAIATGAATAALVSHAIAPGRYRPPGRMVFAACSGGPPSLVGVLAFFVAWGSAITGDFAAAGAAVLIMLPAAAASAASVVLYRRSRPSLRPSFEPLEPDAFAEAPDPPAHQPPREVSRPARPPARGFVARLRRALWLG